MKRNFLKVSMLLALTGMVSSSLMFTSCSKDDDDELQQNHTDTTVVNNDTTPTTDITDTTNTGETSTAVEAIFKNITLDDNLVATVTGENLTQVTSVKIGDYEITTEDKFTITENSINFVVSNIASGEQDVVIKYKNSNGEEKEYTTKITIPEVVKEVSVEEATIDEDEDANTIITLHGNNLDLVTNVLIGDLELTKEDNNLVIESDKITFWALELPSGEQTITLKSVGDKEASVKATIPEVELRPYFDETEIFTTSELGSGWSSEYNYKTQTITYDEEWAGRGWWFGEKDFGDYASIVVSVGDFGGKVTSAQVMVEYTDKNIGSTAQSGKANSDIKVKLASSSVKQIYIQADNEGTIKIKNITLEEKAAVGTEVVETVRENWASYSNPIKISELENYLNDAKGGVATLVFTLKREQYDIKYNYDGVGELAALDDAWKASDDDFSSYSFNSKCNVEDYEVGSTYQVEFDASEIVSKAVNTSQIVVNIYKDAYPDGNNKISVEKVEIKYISK